MIEVNVLNIPFIYWVKYYLLLKPETKDYLVVKAYFLKYWRSEFSYFSVEVVHLLHCNKRRKITRTKQVLRDWLSPLLSLQDIRKLMSSNCQKIKQNLHKYYWQGRYRDNLLQTVAIQSSCHHNKLLNWNSKAETFVHCNRYNLYPRSEVLVRWLLVTLIIHH